MALKFEPSWRFDSPGTASAELIAGFLELILKIASQGNRQNVLEHFKGYFANAAGITHYYSSNESWAETDLESNMSSSAENAPVFIEAFYEACEALQGSDDFAVPNLSIINRVLSENSAGYVIQPPNLIIQDPRVAVAVPERPLSLDEQAQEIIRSSLEESERLLAKGKHRQAVQELLWLLESISTAFQGLETESGTIEGKYFNKIVRDLRNNHKGRTLEMVLSWVAGLHGYLSSPTGGGVRHGTSLKTVITIQPSEARLYCNLIRSYIAFLIAEHERLSPG